MAATKRAPADALEVIAAAIAACRDASGHVRPQRVVEEARNPASVLHAKFEWDDRKAAQRDRLRTASELIRSMKFIVEYEDRRIAVPFYVSDPRSDESTYMPTVKVAKSGALSERVLRDELTRITGAIHRAMSLASAFGLVSSFERMLEQATLIETRLGEIGDGDDAR